MSEYDASMYDANEGDADKYIFDSLLNDDRDPSIIVFDESLHTLSASLQRQYVDTGHVEVPEQDAIDYQEALNDEWRFHGEAAYVTGRCYFLRDGDPDVLAELVRPFAVVDEDGTIIHHDDYNEPYCHLEDVKLRSNGVSVNSIYGSDNERLVAVRVGYGFYRFDDDSESLPMLMYPEDMTQHEYRELPRTRLERQWPKRLEVIDRYLAIDNKTPLMERLTMLVDELQEELLRDEIFRSAVEQYINDELALDQVAPYIMTVHTELGSHDEDDPSDVWTPLALHQPVTVALHQPEVRLALLGDENVGIFMYGATYNETDGDSAEMIVAITHFITSFQSTRARRSLVDVAMLNLEQEVSENIEHPTVEPRDVELRRHDDESEEEETPEEIQDIIETLEVLQNIHNQAEQLKQHRFKSRDAAETAANKFINEIAPILSKTCLFNSYIFEATGEEVIVASERRDARIQQLRDEGLGVYASDMESVRGLDVGESVKGVARGLYPTVGEIDDEDEMKSYTAWVVLSLEVQPVNAHLVYKSVLGDGVPLAVVHAREMASVMLGESVDISCPAVDHHVAHRNAHARAKKEYATLPLLTHIEQLRSAIEQEDVTGYIDLEPANLFADISTALAEAAESSKSAQPLVGVLEAELLDRSLYLVSDVYERTKDRYTLDGGRAGVATKWLIRDIESDSSDEEVAFLVQQADDNEVLRYIPLSSITHCRF